MIRAHAATMAERGKGVQQDRDMKVTSSAVLPHETEIDLAEEAWGSRAWAGKVAGSDPGSAEGPFFSTARSARRLTPSP
jgi:hypothetical protein